MDNRTVRQRTQLTVASPQHTGALTPQQTEGTGDDAVTYTASSYGTCGFTPDPSASDWTAYDSVTEAEVLGWCWANGVDQEAIEASLQADIDLQITPTNGTGVPW